MIQQCILHKRTKEEPSGSYFLPTDNILDGLIRPTQNFFYFLMKDKILSHSVSANWVASLIYPSCMNRLHRNTHPKGNTSRESTVLSTVASRVATSAPEQSKPHQSKENPPGWLVRQCAAPWQRCATRPVGHVCWASTARRQLLRPLAAGKGINPPQSKTLTPRYTAHLTHRFCLGTDCCDMLY